MYTFVISGLTRTRTKMYAGRVACCLLVSHGEYPPRALLRLEKDGRDRQTDGYQTDAILLLPLDATNAMIRDVTQ